MHLPTGPLGRLQSVTVLKKRNSRRRRPRLTSRCMCRVGRKLWTSWRLSAVLSRTQFPRVPLTAVSSHRCCDRPGVLSGPSAGLLAFAATDKHRLAALEAAIANVIYADAFVGVIATSRLWTCVGFRCQTVTVDTGPRIWPPIAQV
jgi:hypothetical protein